MRDPISYHFMQENIAILCQLDVTCTRNKPAETVTACTHSCSKLPQYLVKPHSYVRVWLHKTTISPPPHIFMVPLGPRLVFRTSCRPLAAEMFTCSAWAALATSALGLSDLTADMLKVHVVFTHAHWRTEPVCAIWSAQLQSGTEKVQQHGWTLCINKNLCLGLTSCPEHPSSPLSSL